eukprot:XP_014775048.1 PREDICTED: SEC14-like protein 2 [Octopus bimaculoides]
MKCENSLDDESGAGGSSDVTESGESQPVSTLHSGSSLSSSSSLLSPALLQLTEKQSKILQQFREKLKDVLTPVHDDSCLVRWLKARNFNIDQSEAMFRKDLSWRAEIGADTIVEDYVNPEAVQRYYTGGVCGFDKIGCPVWYDPVGNLDMQGLLKSVKKSALMKNKVKCMEEICRLLETCSKEKNRKINQVVSVLDVKNLGQKHLWKPGVKAFCEIISMFEDHYPEVLKQCFIINAASIFPYLFNIVRPFLSSATQNKIHVLGVNYLSTLQRYIDADQIPAFYGGTVHDANGDPKCSLQICYGGEVPPSYYYNRELLHGPTKPNELLVNARSSAEVCIDVDQPGSLLSWQLTTIDCDIYFGVYKLYKKGSEAVEKTSVVPQQQIDNHLVPEISNFVCEESGSCMYFIYSLLFYSFTCFSLFDCGHDPPPTQLVTKNHSVPF